MIKRSKKAESFNVAEKMTRQPQNAAADIFSSFKGVYARVARKLEVHPSLVSRVANGTRTSPEIEAALHDELIKLRDKLEKYC